eukprot:TRINITY_DN501371_c0_g1_i2.p1 TRINITY_DN501371_c0_g1~~TRINITY_DN501371_c0_g1_i2.p1  ORF type:complete len:190 (-),score=48.37 TRINITY_DN501371_c0_g1_i2:42-611(-)
MFAIYGNSGLNFRSTVDNLYTLSNVDSIARVRNNINEGLPKDHSVKQKKKLYESEKSDEAEAVYKKIANIDTKIPIYQVRDLMTKDVLTLTVENTVKEAYDMMEENQIRQIPILNSDNKTITALINEKDILKLLVEDIEFVQSSMRKQIGLLDLNEVITADPITDIRRVAKVMVDFSLSAVPIVDQDDG